MQLEFGDARSEPWGLPVASSAPAIFTLDGSGRGAAAVLTQDGSVNGLSMPAARGSLVQILAAGEGLNQPGGVSGSIPQGNPKAPVLPVSVTVGGMEAQVRYAGPAPESVADLIQVSDSLHPVNILTYSDDHLLVKKAVSELLSRNQNEADVRVGGSSSPLLSRPSDASDDSGQAI